MKTREMGVGLALTLMGYAAAASAAEPSAMLRQMQGRVFVSQATTMGLARNGMPLYVGNRVMAVSGGAARLVYANGCTVDLPENSMLAVGGADQCSTGQAQVRTTEGFQAKAIGQTLPSAVQTLVMNFDSYNTEQLDAAFRSLSRRERQQLLSPGVLSLEQEARLFQAMSVVSIAKAQAFIEALGSAQGNTEAAAGAAGDPLPPVAFLGSSGLLLGGAGQVGVALGATALAVGIIAGSGGGQGSAIVPGVNPPTNPPISP